MNYRQIILIICTSALLSCSRETIHKSALLRFDPQIDTIISKMTLEEKGKYVTCKIYVRLCRGRKTGHC